MKIVKRVGVFETNSSSTHAVSLRIKGADEAWRSEKEIPEEEREIRSRKEKFFFLMGLMNVVSYEAPWIEEELPELDRSWKPGFQRAREIFLAVLCELEGLDKDKILAELEKQESFCNGAPEAVCQRYFNEGTLDECHCEFCRFDKVDQIIGGWASSKEDMREAALKFYDENCYFLLEEGWYGGFWDLDERVF